MGQEPRRLLRATVPSWSLWGFNLSALQILHLPPPWILNTVTSVRTVVVLSSCIRGSSALVQSSPGDKEHTLLCKWKGSRSFGQGPFWRRLGILEQDRTKLVRLVAYQHILTWYHLEPCTFRKLLYKGTDIFSITTGNVSELLFVTLGRSSEPLGQFGFFSMNFMKNENKWAGIKIEAERKKISWLFTSSKITGMG